MGITISKSISLPLVLVILTVSYVIVAKPASSSAEVIEDSWVSKTPLQKAIGSLEAAVANGKIYAISSSANEEYDPATDTWTSKKPMPTKRHYFTIATYQNKIYVIGGQSGYNSAEGLRILTAANEVYDPVTDTWETKAPMPTPRFYLSANTVNDKIYLIGGLNDTDYNPPIIVSDLNEVYDPQTDTWSTKTPTSNPVYNYASAVLDNKIYLFGGGTSEDDLTQIYDAITDTWGYGQRMPDKTRSIAAAATTGTKAPKRIYVIGGMQGFAFPLDSNRVYNPETDNWTTGAPMITARYGLHVVVVDDLLYAIGGGIEQYTPIGYGTIQPSPEPSSTPEPQSEPFPTTIVVAASVAIVAVVGVVLLVYFRKRNH
jgi:N-acetylneuraminic acid mutarotase